MNICFVYTIGTSNQNYYGKYYGYTSDAPSVTDLLHTIFPSLQQCHSIYNINDITFNVLPDYSIDEFSDKTPLQYNFVYCNSNHFYWNGKRMN